MSVNTSLTTALYVHDPAFTPGWFIQWGNPHAPIYTGVPFRHKETDKEGLEVGKLYVHVKNGKYLGFYKVGEHDKNASRMAMEGSDSDRLELNLPTVYMTAPGRYPQFYVFNEREDFELPLYIMSFSRIGGYLNLQHSIEVIKDGRKHIIFISDQLDYYGMFLRGLGQIPINEDYPELMFTGRFSPYFYYSFREKDINNNYTIEKTAKYDFIHKKIVKTWKGIKKPEWANAWGTDYAYNVEMDYELVEVPNQNNHVIPSVVVKRFSYSSMKWEQEDYLKITFPQRADGIYDSNGSCLGRFTEQILGTTVARHDVLYFTLYRNYDELLARKEGLPQPHPSTAIYCHDEIIEQLDLGAPTPDYPVGTRPVPSSMCVTGDYIFVQDGQLNKIHGFPLIKNGSLKKLEKQLPAELPANAQIKAGR